MHPRRAKLPVRWPVIGLPLSRHKVGDGRLPFVSASEAPAASKRGELVLDRVCLSRIDCHDTSPSNDGDTYVLVTGVAQAERLMAEGVSLPVSLVDADSGSAICYSASCPGNPYMVRFH